LASLFEILVKENYIKPQQLEEAKDKHRAEKVPLQKSLLDLQFVLEETLTRIASEASRLPVSS